MPNKRVRLTARDREAVDGSIPYPGNVNQPDRQFKTDDQYSNYEHTLNHPTPDMRHEWKDDERDEIGFGIPEAWGSNVTASTVRVAANKAVKLSYLLLGNKVAEEVIEDQANDFMLLGPEALDRSLGRFASTGELYAEDDEDDDDDSEEDSKEASEETKVAEEDSKEDSKEEEDTKEASEEDAKVAEEDSKEDSKEEDEEDTKEASEEDTKVAEEDSDDDDSEEEESKEASSSMDIELTSSEPEGEVEPDERLAGLFDDDIPAELPEPGAGREASEKAGIKSLGGQPRVAGDGGDAKDISSIWQSAPDVSEIFN